ncbi:MAG: MBL fold metallo-hydrolase [Sphingomonadales bacterium]|nr:MBL fold metallo-hydrolase [Sphingomonadales bacterium]MDE2171790.1 MBL fold metallo-hydrolase [Sphingomonadales bacterium]
MIPRFTRLPAVAVALAAATLANAQSDPAHYPAQASFPHENRAAVARHLAQAKQLAGADLDDAFNWRCFISPLDKRIVAGVQHDGLVPPTRVFDNLYSIGQNAVSAWAIDTSAGIIVIDTLNNADEARDILVPNMRSLGLDPARIRTVLLTHGHGDHWGGAKYLQDTFGARVATSEQDWAMIESPDHGGGPFAHLVPPRRDQVLKDGDVVTLGNTSVKAYVTPGHTPGTLSLIFPVSDHGKRHMAGLMGGTGGGRDSVSAHEQIASLARWQAITRAAGVDVLVTNHPVHMNATEKEAMIRYLPDAPNPFIYGVEKYQRYMGVMSACSRVQLARLGESGD